MQDMKNNMQTMQKIWKNAQYAKKNANNMQDIKKNEKKT